MANVPGTSGPVDYPNRPEGGIEDGPLSQSVTGPLPGGSNRFPQEAPASVTGQQGAGSGGGGLYPNPGEAATGTVQKGYKGGSYSAGPAGDTQPPAAGGDEFVTGGPNGSSVGALSVPTSFTDL